MFTIKQINQAISEGISLKYLAQSYSEVAAGKLKRIRGGIEQNRIFLTDVATMYATIKLVSAQRNLLPSIAGQPKLARTILRLGIKKKPNAPEKPKTTVKIVITSNFHLYGNLDSLLIDFFLQNEGLRKRKDSPLTTGPAIMKRPGEEPARILVVGRVGSEFFRVEKVPFTPIIFKNDLPDAQELRALAENVKDDDRVLVYHSRFQTVLRQAPYITDIKEAQFEVSIAKKKIDYIFEPEIEKMLVFFDTQISSILLNQAFLESELSRTAARLIAMNAAEDKADQFFENQKKLLAQAKRSLVNRDLLNTVAATFKARKELYQMSS